jgi:hypothetical protein
MKMDRIVFLPAASGEERGSISFDPGTWESKELPPTLQSNCRVDAALLIAFP